MGEMYEKETGFGQDQKVRQVHLYNAFHMQSQFKVIYIKLRKNYKEKHEMSEEKIKSTT